MFLFFLTVRITLYRETKWDCNIHQMIVHTKHTYVFDACLEFFKPREAPVRAIVGTRQFCISNRDPPPPPHSRLGGP